MFANLAEFRNSHRRLGRRLPVPASGRPANDNDLVPRLVIAPPRRARPVLVRRWHTTPAGTLECVWHVVPVSEGRRLRNNAGTAVAVIV
jgi:hypothetical protein